MADPSGGVDITCTAGGAYKAHSISGHAFPVCFIEAQISVAYSVTLPVVHFQSQSSGLSAVGLQRLGKANLGITRSVIRTSANVPTDKLLGIVRWGYSDPDTNNLLSFIEKGWDYFRSSGKVIDYPDLPEGKHLEVWVRWRVDNINWLCVFD